MLMSSVSERLYVLRAKLENLFAPVWSTPDES
jgi:hypothetical protein